MATAKTIEAFEKDIEARIDKCNKAIEAGDIQKYDKAKEALSKVEDEYNAFLTNIRYGEILETEDPIKEAILNGEVDLVSHKENKDELTKELISVSRTTKKRRIELLPLCLYSHRKTNTGKVLDTDWQYTVAKFNQLLCMRVAQNLAGGNTPEEKKKAEKEAVHSIAVSYFMKEQAKAIDLGETPTSNRQLVKMLQSVIDAIMFEDNGNGKNKYTVNSHDVEYLLDCYTKRGSKRLTVMVSKDNAVSKLLSDICYRLLINGIYTVDGFKKVKTSTTEGSMTIVTVDNKTLENMTEAVSV